MPNIAHFDIPADDVPRAKRFYEEVFGWRFNEWRDEPDFYQIRTTANGEPEGIMGALAKRWGDDQGRGFICTISVRSIDETEAALLAHGVRIVYPKNVIPGVGTIIQFIDTEGNPVSVMQYDASAN